MYDKEIKVIKKIIPTLFSKVRKEFFSQDENFTLKKDNTFVTPTDKAVEKLLIKHISHHFPKDSFLSEETQTKTLCTKGRVWLIDPICGTSNFALKIPFFTTNITLLISGKPVLTFSLDYINQDYYWAVDDKEGVFNKKGIVPLSFKHKKRIVFNFGYIISQGTKKHKEAVGDIRKELFVNHEYRTYTYSSSLGFVYAAINKKISGFMVTFTKPWDFVSGAYLIEKNGGIATDFEGKPWSCKSKNIIATPFKEVYQKIFPVIKKYWPKSKSA